MHTLSLETGKPVSSSNEASVSSIYKFQGEYFYTMVFELPIIAASLFLLIFVIHILSKPKNLPPGPFSFPFIGNVPHILGQMPHVAMTKIARTYGKIFSLDLPGQRCVVISSADIAREALVAKKDDFSGRPKLYVTYASTRGGKDIIFGDFSSTLVLQRKITHAALRMYGSRLDLLQQKVCFEVQELCNRFESLEGRNFDPKQHIIHTILNVICAVVFGERLEFDDPEFLKIIEYSDKFVWLLPAANLFDIFPWLRLLPLKFNRVLKEAVEARDEVINARYRQHKETFKPDNIRDLTDAFLKAAEDSKTEDSKTCHLLTEDHIMMSMSDIFTAGFETTASALRWLIAYLIRYPDVQRKAHEEVIRVVGPDRLPLLSDKCNLPYVEAVIAETLRISFAVPLSIPHKTTCNTELAGYNIPKDTMVLFNIWAMHLDPAQWMNPEEFNPMRFIDETGKFISSGIQSFLPFGAGRRICLGAALGKAELFLVTAALLQKFVLRTPVGCPPPVLQGEIGVVYAPKSYMISVTKRQ